MARRLPTWLKRPERKRLLSSEMSLRDRAIVTTFLYSGLRCNELRMLDVADVDFEDKTILVRHAKRGKQRLVPLHAEIETILDEYLGDRHSGPIFLSNRNRRISSRRLRSLIKDLAQRAGLKKDISPHSLRHSFAVSLREADQELDVIQDLLGHASIETTAIYTHCDVGQLRGAVDRIE